MSILDIIEQNHKVKKEFTFNFTYLPMDDSQKKVIDLSHKAEMLAITGCAGSGKSSTIINLIIDGLCHNKKILVVSKSQTAVQVIYDRLSELNIDCLAVMGGKKDFNCQLASKLMDICEGKVNIAHKNANVLTTLLNKDVLSLVKTKRAKAIEDLKLNHRKTLITMAKALPENNKTKKQKIINSIDYDAILSALPVWICTTNELATCLPLKENIFNNLIADETSECDIASMIPAMFRTKDRAFFFGDNMQMKFLSFLEQKKELSFAKKYDIPDDLYLAWRYRTNSMFDWANFYCNESILLNQHYRSACNAFQFNSNEFYNGAIKCVKEYDKDAIQKRFVKGGMTEKGKSINLKEVEAIIEEVKKIIAKGEKCSIGIISPFKQQVAAIEKALIEVIPYNQILEYEIKVGTVFQWQGGEATYMLCSWVISDNSPFQLKTFINNKNHFNVATSRSKKRMINFYSTENLGDGLISKYLNSIK